ncbi:MAG: prolyl oligopeptidase family serine peptidase [Acidobacteria bacterium]|nr:prolyl oligopeptidase family serine peptidase [Acidobacteriota bacterium]
MTGRREGLKARRPEGRAEALSLQASKPPSRSRVVTRERRSVLLMHGEVDHNQGTLPIQTERFYLALKGHGARVRYVTLPYESHRYASRETLLHVAAEFVTWFDRYVKGAGPRATTATGKRAMRECGSG